MNKFAFLTALAVSATMMVGCDDDEEQLTPELSINLEAGVLNVSSEGETATVACTIANPAEGGQLKATTEADWLTLSCNNTNISVVAEANETFEPKSATVNVTYTYGGSQTLSAQFSVEQEARVIPDADYVFTEPFVAGREESMMGMKYFTLYISEEEIPEDYEFPSGADYIHYLIGIFDIEDGKPVANTYSFGSGNGKFSGGAYGTPDAPYYNGMTDGTLTISYEGDVMTLTATLTDSYEKTHFIYYKGTPRFE